jgi:hypothetical protein
MQNQCALAMERPIGDEALHGYDAWQHYFKKSCLL